MTVSYRNISAQAGDWRDMEREAALALAYPRVTFHSVEMRGSTREGLGSLQNFIARKNPKKTQKPNPRGAQVTGVQLGLCVPFCGTNGPSQDLPLQSKQNTMLKLVYIP